tara:strand:+ start:442 stop:774 length:333 start_codon:yes stop_codon:yes gene_type:complete
MGLINREEIVNSVEKEFIQSAHPDEAVDFADDVIKISEQWLQSKEYEQLKGNKRKRRIALKRYIRKNLDLNDSRKSWFIPSFVWIWIAQQVISYIVKIIIENYTDEKDKT